MRRPVACVSSAVLLCAARVWAAGVEVAQSGASPDLKVTVTSPGVYRAVVWQAAGGGIMEFYDLAADPDAKVNLAGWDRGLFEIGWHGRPFKGPDKAGCCIKHVLAKDREGDCYDGCRDWPSIGHKALKAEGELRVIEASPARVRVQAKSWFVWWSKYTDKDLPVEAVYSFYPTGQIAIVVRVRRTGEAPMHWSSEYGPHLFLPGHDKKPEADRGFAWGTPKVERFEGGERVPGSAEELVLAYSEKVKTTFLLTIPPEAHELFDRHMRHNGRSIGWDRVGYGSHNIVMEPGYDSTWACMIQMGTDRSDAAPQMRTPKDAVPHAMQYRAPARVVGAELVKDDPGDFNKDGFNESEGCHVLKGPGPLAFTYERGRGAGFAPAFKVLGWSGPAPEKVFLGGKEVSCAAAVVDGKLVLQVLGRVDGDKAKIGLGK